MRSAVPNNNPVDEIEVLAESLTSGPCGRVRIRELQGSGLSDVKKCSIFLTADQLEEHARECLAVAVKIRKHQGAG